MAVNQLKAGAALNYVIIALNGLLGLLYTPYMLRMLGQNEYGIYTLAASVISYLGLLDFGFGNAIVRYTAKFRANDDREEQFRLFGTFTLIYAVIGILSFIAGLALYFNVDAMFGKTMTPDELDQTRIIMLLLVINLAVSFPLGIYGYIISAYEQFVFLRLVNITRILVSTSVLILILYMGYKAVGLVVVQTVFNFLGLVINYVYCRRKLHIKLYFEHVKWPLLSEIAIYSFWNFLGAIIDKIYWSTGQFILGMKVSTVAVAIFSVALTLEGIYMTFSTAVSGVFLPRVTKMVTLHTSDQELSRLFIRTGRVQFIILGLILSGFIVFGKDFIMLWAGKDYADSFIIAVIFLVSLLIPLIQNLGITILLARNQMKFRVLLYIAIAIVSLVMQMIIIPVYGAIGCAFVVGITLLVGQGLLMNIYYYKSQHLDIPNFWRQILKMSIIPAIMTILGCIAVKHIEISNIGYLLLCIVAYVAVYMPLFWCVSMNNSERELFRAPVTRLVSGLRRYRKRSA